MNIQTCYKRLLLNAFCNWNERYTYSHGIIKDTLQILDLSNEEWCGLHWKRVKNAILVGIEDLSKIYDDISYVHNHCRPISRYEKYLKRSDDRIGIKNKMRSLLISG